MCLRVESDAGLRASTVVCLFGGSRSSSTFLFANGLRLSLYSDCLANGRDGFNSHADRWRGGGCPLRHAFLLSLTSLLSFWNRACARCCRCFGNIDPSPVETFPNPRSYSFSNHDLPAGGEWKPPSSRDCHVHGGNSDDPAVSDAPLVDSSTLCRFLMHLHAARRI